MVVECQGNILFLTIAFFVIYGFNLQHIFASLGLFRMVIFPDISPEIFTFSFFGQEFSLRWYALSYILGFICAILLMKQCVRNLKNWAHVGPPFDAQEVDSLITYLIFGVIVGGRLGYVFFYNPQYYIDHPLEVIQVWDGGMAFHGGFLGVVMAAILYCRVNQISIWSAADLIAFASPPGLMFGRIANFINAELWGSPTTMPWGVVFPSAMAKECPGIVGLCARHPSQLYEAALEGLLLFVVLFGLVRLGFLRMPGFIMGVFICGYGAARFFIEYFRVPDAQFFSFDNPNGYAFIYGNLGFTMGQVLSIPMVLAGVIFIILACLATNGDRVE